MSNDQISLVSNLQAGAFERRLSTLAAHEGYLRDFDRRLYRDLQDGWNMVGRAMTISRKQWNHITTVAADLESGQY